MLFLTQVYAMDESVYFEKGVMAVAQVMFLSEFCPRLFDPKYSAKRTENLSAEVKSFLNSQASNLISEPQSNYPPPHFAEALRLTCKEKGIDNSDLTHYATLVAIGQKISATS